MIWKEYYNQYLRSLDKAKQRLPRQEQEFWNQVGWDFWIAEEFTVQYLLDLFETEPKVIAKLSHLSDEDIQWFIDALADEQSKWFALCLIAQLEPLPESVFPALVQAAVHEIDLSLNGHFVGVACRFGPQRVAEALIGYAEQGTELEKK